MILYRYDPLSDCPASPSVLHILRQMARATCTQCTPQCRINNNDSKQCYITKASSNNWSLFRTTTVPKELNLAPQQKENIDYLKIQKGCTKVTDTPEQWLLLKRFVRMQQRRISLTRRKHGYKAVSEAFAIYLQNAPAPDHFPGCISESFFEFTFLSSHDSKKHEHISNVLWLNLRQRVMRSRQSLINVYRISWRNFIHNNISTAKQAGRSSALLTHPSHPLCTVSSTNILQKCAANLVAAGKSRGRKDMLCIRSQFSQQILCAKA